MICHVVINDFVSDRRIVYVLDDIDFNIFLQNREGTDHLLNALQYHDLFKNRLRWCDLGIEHFHIMIVNMMNILGDMEDTIIADKDSEPVKRLSFFLTAMVILLQEKTPGTIIELLRMVRTSDTEIIYDYSATLKVIIYRPQQQTGLKVVIDNEE